MDGWRLEEHRSLTLGWRRSPAEKCDPPKTAFHRRMRCRFRSSCVPGPGARHILLNYMGTFDIRLILNPSFSINPIANVCLQLGSGHCFNFCFLSRKRNSRGRSGSRWFCSGSWKSRRLHWSRCCLRPGRRENIWRLLWPRKYPLTNQRSLSIIRKSPLSPLV